MRKSRLRKYKSKYQSFLFIAKVAMIWYLFVFSTSYLTAETSALFTSEVESAGKIESGIWPTDYELVFIEKGNDNKDVCDYPYEITRKIKNIGNEDMSEQASYEVYYVENGNPVDGEKVGEGKIKLLKKNETLKLKHKAEKAGRYAFVVTYQTEKKVWSKEVKIDCGSGQSTDNEKQNKQSDISKQEVTVDQLNQDEISNEVKDEIIDLPQGDQESEITQPKEEQKSKTQLTEPEESVNEEVNNLEPINEQQSVTQEVPQESKPHTEEVIKEGEEE